METPSQRRGVHVTPRLPPFEFDAESVREDWFAGDPGTTAAWNALSVIAGAFELQFIEAGRWLVERIEDPAIADETRRFVRQESYHSTVHERFNRVLAARGLPVDPVRCYVLDIAEALHTHGGQRVWLATVLAGEQLVGELGHATLANPDSFAGAAEPAKALWRWHFFEEVEHQAALHDGWVSVFGDDRQARDLRLLGAAYLFAILGVSWPIASLALFPSSRKHARVRRSTWTPVLRQMLGPEGLLRGAGRNLRGLARVGFHPFDNHDPVPTLERWRDVAVDPSWERPVRQHEHRKQVEEAPPSRIEPGDVLAFTRFVGYVLRRSVALERELRNTSH